MGTWRGTRCSHDERRENWLVWLHAAGAATVDATAGPHFSDTGLAIDAARAGQGIALASDVLAGAALADGTMQAPLNQWIRIPGEFRLAFPNGWKMPMR